MLKLTDISVSFGHNHILRNLSCEVKTGDFVAIVGTNGAGKSTFFDTIAGRIKPQKGNIVIEGADVTSLGEQERAGLVTRIFQNTRLNSVGCLTVHQNLAIAHYSRRSARLVDGMDALPREKAAVLLERVGMPASLLERPMKALSGGQRQLIAFVMSTQKIPKVLLLDEPTAALDPQAATTLLNHAGHFIKEHGITTLLITHDPHIALSMGSKIWVLEQGHIARTYTGDQKKGLNPDKLIGQIDYAQIAL